MILLLALLFGAPAPALQLAFPADASGPCKAARFAAAIEERRPTWTVRGESDPRPIDARVQLEQESGRWTLTILRAGKPPLHRALPAEGTDCVETASTAALIVDRALEEIAWTGEAVRLEPLPPPSANSAEMVGAPTNGATARADPGTQLWLELGAGAATSFGSVRPAAQLALSARRAAWSLTLALGGRLSASGPVAGDGSIGSYAASAFDARALLGRALQLGPGAVRIEAAPGLLLAHATASGPLFAQQNPSTAAAFFVAARLGYELALPARFALALRLEGRALPHALAFAVQGYSGDFSSSHASADLALCLARNFF